MKIKLRIALIFFSLIFLIQRHANAQVPVLDWVTSFGHLASDAGMGITTDAAGNIYTTGHFSGTIDFDPGIDTFNITSRNNSQDAFIVKLDASGNFVWAKSIGDTIHGDIGYSIITDVAGNVYTTGQFNGTVDFDPGTGVFLMTSGGGSDIFISKLNSLGNFIWAKKMGGFGNDAPRCISLDSEANIYTTGMFSSVVDFDPDAATYNLTSSGGYDIFISKLDSSGNFIWAKKIGSINDDYGNSIVSDASGNTYTTGRFKGTTDFDPGIGTYNLISSGNTDDIYLLKLNASGNFVWAKAIGNSADDSGFSITLDSGSNMYATGVFQGTVDFDPGAATYNLLSPAGAVFVCNFDSSGSFNWARSMYDTLGTGYNNGFSIKTDAVGSIYSTGYFSGVTDFDPGAGTYCLTSAGDFDIFILKLDASGNFVWAAGMGGTGFADYGRSISIDLNGNVYTTGQFDTTVDFDPGNGVFNLSSVGGLDVFVHKMNQTSVGITENNFADKFLLYPNPTSTYLTINLGSYCKSVHASINDITGKIIYTTTVTETQKIEVNTNDFAHGIYLVQIQSAEFSKTEKLIITK